MQKKIRPSVKARMPESARKVFSGRIFDVYQWPQAMYDGTIETFEMLKRPDTAVVYPVLPDGRIVLCRQKQPGRAGEFLSAVSGRADRDETILDAARRELQEEAGMQAGKWHRMYAVQPHSKIEWTVFGFVAKNCLKTGAQKLDAGERITTFTVPFEKFAKMLWHGEIEDPYLSLRFANARSDHIEMKKLKSLFDPQR